MKEPFAIPQQADCQTPLSSRLRLILAAKAERQVAGKSKLEGQFLLPPLL